MAEIYCKDFAVGISSLTHFCTGNTQPENSLAKQKSAMMKRVLKLYLKSAIISWAFSECFNSKKSFFDES